MQGHLERIESLLSQVPTSPEGMPAAVGALMAHGAELRRDQLRITLFGAAKTGKTSIANGLLGASVLGARAFGSSRTVMEVGYSDQPELMVIQRDGSEDCPPFDSLRNLSPPGSADVAMVRVSVPLPLLRRNVVIVDTPGLLSDPDLDAIARAEIQRTDLAVMVLAADKILSAEERAQAASVNDLLVGNIVFLINRIDLIEEAERPEILEWAEVALQGLGNDLVGRPRILACHTSSDPAGLEALRTCIELALIPPLRGRVTGLARLGIMSAFAAEAMAAVATDLEAAAQNTAQLRALRFETTMTERADMKRSIAGCKVRLSGVAPTLHELGNVFVETCTVQTRDVLASSPRARTVPLQVEGAIKTYIQGVQGGVDRALRGAPAQVAGPVPGFDMSNWIFRLDLEVDHDPATRLAVDLGERVTGIVHRGDVGREAGASVGGWIGKNILQHDIVIENEKQMAVLARSVLKTVERQATKYIEGVAGMLDDAESTCDAWLHPMPELDAAEFDEKSTRALLLWCQAISHAIQLGLDDVRATAG
jgi:Dynamin family